MTAIVVKEFGEWARVQGLGPARAEVRVEDVGIPHVPGALPRGWQGVYCFKYQQAWLKVGKAGPRSAARWTSHHYHPGRAPSTLAFSLLRYRHFSEINFLEVPDLKACLQSIDADRVGDWIRKNTRRVNFLIRSELGPAGLDRLEKIAHGILRPIFEGDWDPQGRKTISQQLEPTALKDEHAAVPLETPDGCAPQILRPTQNCREFGNGGGSRRS